ncbi:acyltransferase family protein [Streptomyces fractus]|uniref:acyltransferase family protein n=1 Tax=Streptomyces fractus TaxID=641806 RepID=UPI003CF01F39
MTPATPEPRTTVFTDVTEALTPTALIAPDGRVLALDGVRALAVTAVAVFHMNSSWLVGGYVGADVFFVLSGYLITSLLLKEHDGTGRVRLASFWSRRARRLLPALLAVLVTLCATAALAGGDAVDGLRGDTLSSLLFTDNWWQILHHTAHFAADGPLSPFTHLWSLAIEGQFYLLWPLLLLAMLWLLRRRPPAVRRLMALLTVGLAAASYALMATLFAVGEDPFRIHHGTDTHCGPLLVGAAAACLLPLHSARTLHAPQVRRAFDAAGVLGLVLLLCYAVGVPGTDTRAYYGGLALAAVAALGVILAASVPGSLARFLSVRPLVWIGERSYALYLWHWPVIALFSRTDAVHTWVAYATELSAPLLLARFTHRCLEAPLRAHGLRGALLLTTAWFREGLAARLPAAIATALALALLITAAAWGLIS